MQKHLNINGYIYVELPDGENALKMVILSIVRSFTLNISLFLTKNQKVLAEKVGLQCAVKSTQFMNPAISTPYTHLCINKKINYGKI